MVSESNPIESGPVYSCAVPVVLVQPPKKPAEPRIFIFRARPSNIDINLLNPDPMRMLISDIAYLLANSTRYNGGMGSYSIAEHSVYVAHAFRRRQQGDDEKNRALALSALLHDAAEAYLGDVSSQLKANLQDYKRFEKSFEKAVEQCFFLEPNSLDNKDIAYCDKSVLNSEFAHMGWNDIMNAHYDIEPISFHFLSPENAEEEFLRYFLYLYSPEYAKYAHDRVVKPFEERLTLTNLRNIADHLVCYAESLNFNDLLRHSDWPHIQPPVVIAEMRNQQLIRNVLEKDLMMHSYGPTGSKDTFTFSDENGRILSMEEKTTSMQVQQRLLFETSRIEQPAPPEWKGVHLSAEPPQHNPAVQVSACAIWMKDAWPILCNLRGIENLDITSLWSSLNQRRRDENSAPFLDHGYVQALRAAYQGATSQNYDAAEIAVIMLKAGGLFDEKEFNKTDPDSIASCLQNFMKDKLAIPEWFRAYELMTVLAEKATKDVGNGHPDSNERATALLEAGLVAGWFEQAAAGYAPVIPPASSSELLFDAFLRSGEISSASPLTTFFAGTAYMTQKNFPCFTFDADTVIANARYISPVTEAPTIKKNTAPGC